jgi:hypothetical protein
LSSANYGEVWRLAEFSEVENEDMLFVLPLLDMPHLIKTVIPNTQQAELRRIRVPGKPTQNMSETPSQAIRQVLGAHDCEPSYK